MIPTTHAPGRLKRVPSIVLAVALGSGLLAAVSAPASAAVGEPGRAFSWGRNTSGDAGIGTVTTATPVAAVDTAAMTGAVTRLATTEGFGCAVADARAWCWGSDQTGQVGDGGVGWSATGKALPVDTTGVLAGVAVSDVAVSAASGTLAGTACAVGGARLYCWGQGTSGQLGNLGYADSPVPVAVNASGQLFGKTLTKVSVGSTHACAVASGRAYCWGADDAGQLGNGSVWQSNLADPSAVDVTGALAGKTVSAVSAGFKHTCAIADGAAYCWGADDKGQLGDDNQLVGKSSPVPVAALAGKTVTAISAGTYDTCAVADGAAYCWGSDVVGQLGDDQYYGYGVYMPVPVSTAGVLGGRTVVDVAVGRIHACALTSDGVVVCWGNGGSFTLGSAFTDGVITPQPYAVDTDGALAGRKVLALSVRGVVAAAAPGTPVVSATAGNASATATWTLPGDGGSPVDHVSVQVTQDNGATWKPLYDGAPVTTATATGLANGAATVFRVNAHNVVGTTPWAQSAPVTPAAPPVVTTPTATPVPVTRPRQILWYRVTKPSTYKRALTWKRPAITANNAATAYRYRVSSNAGRTWSRWYSVATKATYPKLTFTIRKGRYYVVTLVPVNRAGAGKATAVKFRT